ncbi:MAG TPA: type II toxin-antitoxin system RelE/ParE family toxin [archaeon]|nr:type II toxin-antitoxin system RelE/ParE family toxin [archaeon]
MYEILFAQKALKQLQTLEKNVQRRVIAVLERARIRPQDHFEKLVGEKAYKIRVGDYRIIADINHTQCIVLVIKIGHRKNVYNK